MANQNLGLFLPTTEVISTALVNEAAQGNVALQQALIRIVQAFNSSNIAMNQKDTGYYIADEFNTGKLYFGNPLRPVFRKVIDFGALPNAGTKTIPHGLSPTADWLFVNIYAGAMDPISLNFIPLPYAEPTAGFSIALGVDATNVIVITGVDYSSFTRCYVTLEYIKT